jgi:hypothetical protein
MGSSFLRQRPNSSKIRILKATSQELQNGTAAFRAGEACRRIGVWGSKTAFRHRYNDQEVSTELMMLCKRRHADTPIRRYADTLPAS